MNIEAGDATRWVVLTFLGGVCVALAGIIAFLVLGESESLPSAWRENSAVAYLLGESGSGKTSPCLEYGDPYTVSFPTTYQVGDVTSIIIIDSVQRDCVRRG